MVTSCSISLTIRQSPDIRGYPTPETSEIQGLALIYLFIFYAQTKWNIRYQMVQSDMDHY